MELSKETLKGLALIQNANALPEETFLKLLESAVSCILRDGTESKSIARVHGSKPETAKSVFAALTCLFVEAARRDLDGESFEAFLKQERLTGSRAEKLTETYIAEKESIRAELEGIGNNLPHVVDVDWRLDYCVKSGTQNAVGSPIYHVRFTVKKHDGLNHVTFACSVQQLQELVYKFKDAVRHAEKLAN